MKPILRTNQKQRGSPRDNRAGRSHQSFPLTDYNYQPTAETEVNTSASWPAIKSPASHKFGSEFLYAEKSRDYVGELLFFIVITGLAAWPIMSMLIAVIRMIRH